MIENEIYTNVHLDGNDSVGKGTATKAVIASLLLSEKISLHGEIVKSKEVVVVQTDYPQYWGFGALIRTMNSEVGRDYFKKEGISKSQELHIRKAMYAIDRLIAVAIFEKSRKQFQSKKVIQVSDRGPLAQTITHAFFYEGKKKEFMKSLEDVQDADYGYINSLKPNFVLLDADITGLTGGKARGELDDLEGAKYQALSREGFDFLRKNASLNVKTVVTSVNKRFRPKKVIADEILQTMDIRIVGGNKVNFDVLKTKDFNIKRNAGNLLQIGALEFMDTFYPDATEKFGINYSTIRDLDLMRKVFYFMSEAEMSEYLKHSQTEPKKLLITHEEMLSKKVGSLLKKRPVGDYAKNFLTQEAREAGEYLLNEYTDRELLHFVTALERRFGGEGSYSRFLRDLFIHETPLW